MNKSSRYQVAIEFGYAPPIVLRALSKQEFSCAGDLIEYLELHEEELQKEEKSALRKETEHLYRNVMCLWCETQPRTIVFLPCAHLCLCSDCSDLCKCCPLPNCNSCIESKIVTYIS